MKTGIVYDQPGRIRFRFGVGAFTEAQECGLLQLLRKSPYVKKCEVHYENGGILLYYKKGKRREVVRLVRSIRFREIPEVAPDTTYSVAKLDHDFQNDLMAMLVKRGLYRLFLPASVRSVITIYQGLHYIKTALSALFSGQMCVEVLDGASITACLLQRNFSTASTVMFLLQISARLEAYTHDRTRAALTESLALQADTVWLVHDEGVEVQIPMEQLCVGDQIHVRMGTAIPVDGEVTKGEASVNESSMTGEPLAVGKREGDTVFAGTVIEEGDLCIRVRKLSGETRIHQIIDLIDSSEQLKAGVQGKAERLADQIVPFSFLAFALILLFTQNVTKAVSVLMVDYSCAIKLSTPISVISAIREAADHAITVKGGKYLEAYAEADTLVFDKTGTLTKAVPHLERVLAFHGYTEDEVLRTAACLEEHFPHSVAKAIVQGAADKGLSHPEEHAEVRYIVAHGIATTLHNKPALIGSYHFLVEDEGVVITAEEQAAIDQVSGACSVVYLSIDGQLAGALCISDPPRPEAKVSITALRDTGIDQVIMLTGDSEGAARMIAHQLGITSYCAQVLPEDKHRMVEALKAQGRHVIMVGDGINDAPALAAADVSVAMSDASDIARETADITLRGANLTELVRLRVLSTRLMERIHRNYRFIVAFNTSLIVLGLFGVLTPSTSALLHNVSTMLICAKSMTPLLKENDASAQKAIEQKA